MSNLQRHKKSDAVKWVLTGIAFLIVAVLIVGLCLQVFAKSENLKPSNWFKKDEETEQLPEGGDKEGKEDVGAAAFVQDTKERGIRLMSSSVAREVSDGYQSSFRLEATVLPTTADNKNVKWSLAWETPQSTWASGKDVYEYMAMNVADSESEVTADAYGAVYSIDVTPKKAYGEKVVVTVTAEDNAEAFASKTFGYVKRVSNVEINIPSASDTIFFGKSELIKGNVTYALTAGTVEPSASIDTVKVYLKPINSSNSSAVAINNKLHVAAAGGAISSGQFQINFALNYLSRIISGGTANAIVSDLKSYVSMQTDMEGCTTSI